ncbi:unnamed protein product [Rotaria magnacalcarata]|uniref:DNA topoisomerase (ATP-hydrolyzing) n=1 Tax=Rotaria magnacalcarata TaxID=392030 RepID=A0A8S2QTB3_9BILA|nr:unnamed protein product [Rotaria magnacalcarata]
MNEKLITTVIWINNKILRLNYGENNANRNDLSKSHSGKSMIMADQDQNGSHMKDLVANLIQYKRFLSISTAEEAKEYFSNIDRHRIIYKYDSIKDDLVIRLVFNSALSDDRKDWIKWHTEDVNQKT